MEDKGVVDFARFTRTLDSLGCKFLPKELRALYQKHSDNAEVMTYQQFCGLLFEMGSGNKDNQNVVF